MPATGNDNRAHSEMQEVHASLERLERGEWWRWSTALAIMLALTIGFFVLTNSSRDAQSPNHLQGGGQGLLALVILFDAFVIYQRFTNGRLRRKLALQIATVATVEALRPSSAEEPCSGQVERRRWLRRKIDERLRVVAPGDGKNRCLYGRITDISENGIGAVVPDAIDLGDTVTVEFTLNRKSDFMIEAVVRYRRGFRYGFSFVDVPAPVMQELNEALGTPVHVG